MSGINTKIVNAGYDPINLDLLKQGAYMAGETLEDLLKDTEELLNYVNNLNDLNLEDLKIEEIEKKQQNFEKKYKDFLPKDNLDTKK